MEILIRPFERPDMDPLYFLDQRCTMPGARLTYERLLTALLERNVSAVVMVEDMEEKPPPMLGSLIVRSDSARRTLHVLALMVDPDFRRLGLARRLMDWAVHLGASKGLSEVAVVEESDEAAPFLEALGFQRTDELAPGFRRPDPRPRWTRDLIGPRLAELGERGEGERDDTGEGSEGGAGGAGGQGNGGGSNGGGGNGGHGNGGGS